jgi:hypothetical protein
MGKDDSGRDTNWDAGAIALCPGIHDPTLTQSFVQQLQENCLLPINLLVFPSDRYAAYSSVDVLRFLHERLHPMTPNAWLTVPVVFIGFSAGVVGAMGAAIALESLGGHVRDGWGVPLIGNFPHHRLSHDYFTHWSSALLGAGQDSFYAEPAVQHLDLWRSPQTVQGWWVNSLEHPPHPTTALQFLSYWLQHYAI